MESCGCYETEFEFRSLMAWGKKLLFICFHISHFIYFCIGDLSWLHWTPLRRCGSPRRNTRKIAPVPSTGKHFNGDLKAAGLPHLCCFTSLSLGLPMLPSLLPYPPVPTANLPRLPSAAKACLPCPLPGSHSGHPTSGTGAGYNRASLVRSAPIKHRKKGFSGHQSILLTIVSFKANASISA